MATMRIDQCAHSVRSALGIEQASEPSQDPPTKQEPYGPWRYRP
jgi:hypothetical protein